ncbi:hypothetical protein K2X05_06985, partial [bacterium]|nr:hypothetical protein [bacterium]
VMNDDVRDWLMVNSPVQEFSELKKKIVYPSCIRDPEFACNKKKAIEFYPNANFTDLVNMAIETFHVNTEDWSMDFKTGGRFAAFERFGLTNDPRPPLRAALERVFSTDPDFKNISCKEAEQKSLENFSDLKKIQNFRSSMQMDRPPARPLIQRCISCHVEDSGFVIPAIPFDSPEKLKNSLQRVGYKRGTLLQEIEYRTGAHAGVEDQMPPRGVASETQRKELIQYLKSL